MHKLLIVEDDPTIAQALAEYLAAWNYEIECVTDFRDVLAQFLKADPHLVLMDLSLPFRNGFHWCGEIRRVSTVPILFLSSASDNLNLIMAMNLGADDFVAKPFDRNVLAAKIAALLRRAYSLAGQRSAIEHRGALLHLGSATLEYQGRTAELTKNEYRILRVLMENAGNIVSRDELMIRLWESESFIDDNTLTVNMTRLRKTLEDIGLAGFVTTKKGLGYGVV